MRVDLAAQVCCYVCQCVFTGATIIMQVLSSSVSKALQLYGGVEAEETAIFTEMFNNFFDCLNVKSISAGKRTRNAFKSPYRSATDWRLKVRQ